MQLSKAGSVVLEKTGDGPTILPSSKDDSSSRASKKKGKIELGKLSNVDQEKVIKEGVVKKKSSWIFYNKRKLILTSRPRLSYYDADSGEYKVRFAVIQPYQ